jgi:NAD(P)-dependent dehydrogenase (short-subunit alcohol dehydrogenase family)
VDLELTGKSVLITGSSKGIGYAAAEALAAEGCRLVLVARGVESLEAAGAALHEQHGAEVVTVAADMAKPADQQRVAQAHGDVDILINNAGANPAGEIDELDEETWRAAWDLKLYGYINMTRFLYVRMKARGEGVIVNVIGNSAEWINARYIMGSTGNLGLMGFTRALGSRSTDFGVRVVGVNPGLTATDRAVFMLKGWSQSKYGTEERWQEFQEEMNLPFARMGTPKEMADVIAFVSSPRASYMSGTVVTVDGGASYRNH